MEIAEVDGKDYGKIFSRPTVVYNSVSFTTLNEYKVEEVRRMIISEGGKPRFGLTVGLRSDGSFAAPFSAPFACFDLNRHQSAPTVVRAVESLSRKFTDLTIILPPSFYSPDLISKMELALIQTGSRLCHADWNCHIDLTQFDDYKQILPSYERNLLGRARQEGFGLVNVNDDPARAYAVVVKNHLHKGYPVRMTLEQLTATASGPSRVVDGYFFVLTNGREDVASAIVYDVTPDIVQVIYWGDVPGTSCRYPMNLLAYCLVDFFKQAGKRILDIGPSSESGQLSEGLCSFKERIGCSVSPKFTFQLGRRI